MTEQRRGLDGRSHQREEEREQRELPVHDLQQFIEQQDQRQHGENRNQIRCESPAEKRLMRQDVGGRGRRIVGDDHSLTRTDFREESGDDHDQVQDAGKPGGLHAAAPTA